MFIADTLSRAYLPTTGDATELNKEMEVMVHGLVTSLSVSPSKLDQLVKVTAQDCELQDLVATVRKGWPTVKSESLMSVRPYWTIRDEIFEAEGLLFYGEKLIIPKQLRREMLATIHECHLGMEKCKSRARASVYWPNMSSDIEDFVLRCSTCNRFKPKQQKEPLIPHKVPDRPWQKLGMDLFQFGCKDYLVIVDYYSKFPEICMLENKTASNVILHLKSVLARNGIPEVIMSDNMPFSSRTFREFARKWDIELVTSSPTYAQSNGLSERMVQTIKNFLRTAEEDNSDPYIALLEYRNTPLAGTDYSPAQLLMSRRLRSRIPTGRDLLTPKVAHSASEQLRSRQDRQKYQYDKRAKSLPQIRPGESVRVRVNRTWEPARVRQKHTEPRSFIIQTPNGRKYRRNRRDLLKTAEPPPTIIGTEIEEPTATMTNATSEPRAVISKPQGTPGKQQDSVVPKTVPSTSNVANSVKTSSGRVVKPPTWFKDYTP
ncbi:uncharacterized protein K02A2.6-like [Mizuhopecten yessoensis]|uniref:uncharacterized protein K02A2.6-like n=1 Tax=Mizuhopecten yessoensis TaxID=6573 RepID=UPI000B45A799|nr:uncharacterized protein K02A2.6-like [Mizuhopecten yessoensis]